MSVPTAIASGAFKPPVHQQRKRLLCGRHARGNARSAPAEPPDRSGRSFVDARKSSSAFLLITSAPVTHAPYTVPWPDAGVVMWRKYQEKADAERSQMNGTSGSASNASPVTKPGAACKGVTELVQP